MDNVWIKIASKDISNNIYYHGTKHNFDKFDKKYISSNDIQGFFFAKTINLAHVFGEGSSGGEIVSVKKVKLYANNVIDLNEFLEICKENNVKPISKKAIQILKQKGIDGIDLDNVVVVFEPEQIKILEEVNK